ncbi:MAG: ABC transporter ATP-binding protein [Chloroflexota bacterium]
MTQREFRLENEYHYDRRGPLRWIISHTLRYPHLPALMVLAAIVNNSLVSFVQVYIGRAFDLISTPDWATNALLILAGSALASSWGSNLTGLLRNYAAEFLAQLIERNGRDELYVSLLGKSQTFHGRQRIGDVMARATNDVRMLNYMFSPGLMLITDSIMAAAMPVVLISRLNPELLPVPIAFLVLLLLTLIDYDRQLTPVTIHLREQFGALNAGLAEAISGIEVVKANVQEHYERDKFLHNARRYRDFFVKQGEIQARYLPLLMFSLAWAAGFLHATWLWRAGSITLGEVITFMGLMSILRFPTFISIFSVNMVQLGIASAGRVLELINAETMLDENPQGIARPIQGEVVFENVSFGYGGANQVVAGSEAADHRDGQGPAANGTAAVGRPPSAVNSSPWVLKNISFTARPGQTIAIVGQTGSGKTSLTRLINRIFDVDSGRVLVDGMDVREWSLESLRSQISTIEQDVFLFSRTIAENIAFGYAEASAAEIETAAHEAQAHDFITSFEQGYDTEVGERGVTLSGGQRQRIAIARAFLTNPRILILDDSTSAIDSATEDQIQRAMRRISRQRTTFLITHRLSQIRWADHILVLQGGELVDQGQHEELLGRSPAYRRIFARYD